MSEENQTDVATVEEAETQVAAPAKGGMPAILQQENPAGLDEVAENVATPRLRIMQDIAKDDSLKERFESGEVYVAPIGKTVAAMGETFVVIPVLHYVTFEIHSDINDDSNPMVIESTRDRNSEIAKRSQDRDLREEDYKVGSNKYTKKYLKCLNYIFLVDSGPCKGMLAVYTFSSGDYKKGEILNTLIKTRESPVIWGNRFELGITRSKNRNGNTWWSFEFFDPEDESGDYIQTQDMIDKCRSLFEGFTSMLESGEFVVASEDATVED